MSWHSTLAMYLVQSVIHALIALYIVELSILIWRIHAPKYHFRYRLMALVLPAILFPIYQWINPERGSFYFVEDVSLFSTARWGTLHLWGVISLFSILASFLIFTALFSCIQEFIPTLRRLRQRHHLQTIVSAPPDIAASVREYASGLHITPPDVWITDDTAPQAFTRGLRRPAIYISKTLLTQLTPDEISAVIAHELAHIFRRSNAMMVVLYSFRILMFYNPITLALFRRLLQDDEQACDDVAVKLSGSPDALVAPLRVMLTDTEATPTTIQSSGQRLLLQDRIAHIELHAHPTNTPFGWGRFFMTTALIIVINYFVV